MDFVLRAVGLSKQYNLYRRPVDRLIELVTGVQRHTVFPALNELSFEVPRGESLGIIGQNGAGKSTLLKLICGVTTPSTGSLESNGTISSILELGTGFHPEFTGRENAVLNAAILGLSPSDMRRRLPDILEFSELGTFLDRPVKTYSSGMYMRLAFSVAVNVDPDILVIDEALAVGDGHFQKKCIDKIRQFQERGKTILFCSHALYYISHVCQRALWLDQGSLMKIGPAIDVVHDYETFLLQRDRELSAEESESTDRPSSPVRVREVAVLDHNGEPRNQFSTGDEIQVRLIIDSDSASQPVHALIGVTRSADEFQCFVTGTHADGLPPMVGRNSYEVVVRLLEIPLLKGEYDVVAFAGDEHAMTAFDRRSVRAAIKITGDRFDVGLVEVKHRWEFEHVAESAAPSR